jgi:hypothetical protein
MSEVKKISEEQLENLQKFVQSLQGMQSQIGGLFIQAVKAVVMDFFQSEEGLRQLQKALQDEYGNISVNIQDGTYSEVVEEVPVEEA